MKNKCIPWGKTSASTGQTEIHGMMSTQWGKHSPGCEEKVACGGSSISTGKIGISGRKKTNVSQEEKLAHLERGNADTWGNPSPAMTGTHSYPSPAMTGTRSLACKGLCWISPCLGGKGLVGRPGGFAELWCLCLGGLWAGGDGGARQWAPPPPRFRLCARVNQTLGRERGGHRRCLPEGRTIWVNGSLRIGWKNGCLPELALGHMGEPVWAWPFFSQRKMGMSGLAHVHIGSR